MQLGKIKPIEDTIIALRQTAETTAGGIVLPDSDGKKRGTTNRATVLSVGPGKTLFVQATGEFVTAPMPCKKDDVVLFAAMAGLEIGEEVRRVLGADVDAGDLIILRPADILATVEE